jgi:hypothetical protein
MKKEEIAPGIVVYSDVIEKYENLVEIIEKGIINCDLAWGQAETTGDPNSTINKNFRDAGSLFVNYKDKEITQFLSVKDEFFLSLSNIFFSYFSKLENDYKLDYSVDTSFHHDYEILKYGIGQHVSNHVDDSHTHHRRVSIVYYLNEDYDGGEIVFPRFGINYKPKANQLLLFPSNYMYNHTVTPVKSGERYTVVSWLT